MADTIRAGVIGASGIGKHHAKWLTLLGCDVVFAGTSAETVEATAANLADQFGFAGSGYVGAERMLDEADLDLVVVASPADLHHGQFLAAAKRGCHILCEKPLAWDTEKPVAQVVAEAEEMVWAAREASIVAGVNTQYVGVVEPYLALCEQAGQAVDRDGFSRFYMRMDSRGGKSGASGEKIWIDLSPHPLSVLVAFAGPGAIAPGSEACVVEDRGVDATFEYATDSGRTIQARIETCNVPEGSLTRRFGVDDVLVDYEGRNDEDGVYAAYLQLGGDELKTTDFMQSSITRFVDAVRGQGAPAATLDEGLTNLKMQLGLLEVGRSA